MKTSLCLTLTSLIAFCLFSSCSSRCQCQKDLGCAVLTAKKKQNILTDIVITRVVLCSQTDYHFDYKLQDSVRAFINRYTTDSSYVDVKDSIYKHYEPVWVRGNMRRYTDDGYDCECPR